MIVQPDGLFPGFLFADYLNHFGFLPAQRDFVSQHPVFDRVSQRSIQNYLHGLAFDEAHFHNPLAETTVA